MCLCVVVCGFPCDVVCCVGVSCCVCVLLIKGVFVSYVICYVMLYGLFWCCFVFVWHFRI